MPLDANALKTGLSSAINGKDNAQDAHDAIAGVINSYMNSNLKATGVYSGIIAGTPPAPDPLSNSYVFSFSGCSLTKEGLAGAASVSLSSWMLYISTCLMAMRSGASDDRSVVTITPVLMPPPIMLSADFSGCEDYNDSMGVLADAIVSAFASPAIPISGVTCTSTAGGLGTLVPGAFV